MIWRPLLLGGVWGAVVTADTVTTAGAGEWEIQPRASVDSRLTDNVRGVNNGQGKESDLITAVSVGGSVTGEGARAQVSADLTLSRDFFLNESQLNSNRENFVGAGNVEVLKDHLIFDARAALSQETITRDNQVSAGERTVQENQTRVVNASVGPTGFFSVGPWANVNAGFNINEVRFLDTDQGEADVQAPDNTRSAVANATIASGRYFSRLAWSGAADFVEQERAGDSQFRRRTVSLGAEYAVTRKISALAQIGYEDIVDQTLVEDIIGPFWSVGTRLRPGPRTMFRLEFGQRFDRFVWSGDFAYVIDSQTTINASYAVNVENQQLALTNALGALVFDDTGLLVNPFTGLAANPNEPIFDLVNEVGEVEQFTFAFQRTRERNDYSISGSFTKRAFELDDSEEAAVSVNGSYTRRLSSQTTGTLNASYSELLKARGDSGGDRTFRANATLSTTLADSLRGTVSYRFLIRQQDIGTTLTENIISVGLRKQF